jgi:hypothetical protein
MNNSAKEPLDLNTNFDKRPVPVASALYELISQRNDGSVYRSIEATSGDDQFKMREWGRGATRLGIGIISLLIIFILSLVHPDALRIDGIKDAIKVPFIYGR